MAGPFKQNYLVTKCCIIGLGLMGGSMGMALGKYGVALERWGYDLNPRAMEEAKARGAVDETGPLSRTLDGAELVIMATPVGAVPLLLETIAPLLDSKALVSDMGSSKRVIAEAMCSRFSPERKSVGGHPMTGSQLSGVGSASAELFRDAVYFLTPVRDAPQNSPELMEKVVRLIGAHPLRIDAREHDELMAPLSHLPQLVSVALVNVMVRYSRKKGDLSSLVGGGFKDTTRIAAGDPLLWRDIFISNKDNVKESLQLFCKEMEVFIGCLDRGDEEGIYRFLKGAASFRRSLE